MRQAGIYLLPLLGALANPISTRAADLDGSFQHDVRPLLKQYCAECHNDQVTEAEIDFTAIQSWGDVRKVSGTWLKVSDVIQSHQMPPPDSPQWPASEREKVLAWVQAFLTEEAAANAGDPGPVLLRRLNNAEYTYTLRDLTGLDSLNPTREFPTDGAAGEGFTNASAALSLSPAMLTKYFDAAKEITKHLVLLPEGARFSPNTTPSDWTNDAIASIREIYGRYTDQSGGSSVNLQGIVFDTNQGGRLPFEKYLKALHVARSQLESNPQSIDSIAIEHRLNAKYLRTIWNQLHDQHSPSLIVKELQKSWAAGKEEESVTIVNQWQKALWRFSSIGHIGKVNGPKAWQEPIEPISSRQELRTKIPPLNEQVPEAGSEIVTYYLSIGDAGDGHQGDLVIIDRPRLVMEGRPELLLRDVRPLLAKLDGIRAELKATTQACLTAAEEAQRSASGIEISQLATKHGVRQEVLEAWFNYLGIGVTGQVQLGNILNRKMESAAGYDFVKGWVGDDALSVLANSSDQHVRVPGNMPPHSIAVHPSPTQSIAIGWKSPGTMRLNIQGFAQHAHPECGNGVAWSLELRRGNTRQTLAKGISHGGKQVEIGPIEQVPIQSGDLVSLVVAPRDGNHSCDLTTVDLQLTAPERKWHLANDLSADLLKSNPHPGANGTETPWVLYSEPANAQTGYTVPAGSLLARWQSTADEQERKTLAVQVHELLNSDLRKATLHDGDRVLHQQLTSLSGPLMGAVMRDIQASSDQVDTESDRRYGLDRSLFGKLPDGSEIDSASLAVQAPAVIEIRLPRELAAGAELMSAAQLHPALGREGSVQVQLLSQLPLSPGGITGDVPVLVQEGSKSKTRFEQSFRDFRSLFPIALCYTKIVPVDEVVTLTLFYREDQHLQTLMLDEAEKKQLDQLWDELHYVSRDALASVDAYEQLWQFATQDADPSAFEPLRAPILAKAAAFREQLAKSEPTHIDSVVRFASLAYRRPLQKGEATEIQQLYHRLRSQELSHEDAIRLLYARVLVAPSFLYRAEVPGPGRDAVPVSATELASRLSYFLWSSAPDSELRRLADEGTLQDEEVLKQQVVRMLQDPKSRRLATEFACQWLHVYEFDSLDEKSETHFPTFVSLRSDMYEESIQVFKNHFQMDRPFMELFDSDYTFLNDRLAKHYGIDGVDGSHWRRVDGLRVHHRGGVLGMASTLSKQSGASRTSPILRGNWLSEIVLGERLPRPPKNVPQLTETAPQGMTERQMIERHSSDPACSKCHARIDPFGYALESFDAIGRYRESDANGLPIDTKTQLLDTTQLSGVEDLRKYLTHNRRSAVARQFCRKLVGYALGRSVQLSDEQLLRELTESAVQDDTGLHRIVQQIVTSKQFREIRGTNHD